MSRINGAKVKITMIMNQFFAEIHYDGKDYFGSEDKWFLLRGVNGSFQHVGAMDLINQLNICIAREVAIIAKAEVVNAQKQAAQRVAEEARKNGTVPIIGA